MEWLTDVVLALFSTRTTDLDSHHSKPKRNSDLNLNVNRSSHRSCSVRKVVLRNFAKFTWKHLCPSLFFNKVAGLRPATLLKRRLWHRCLPVNFVKFLRTPFLQNTPGRLLLHNLISFSVYRTFIVVIITASRTIETIIEAQQIGFY